MNTGLQDAFNLAWKLAMVLRDEAPEKLLASYDAERHPVDARIQRETDMMLRSFLLRNPVLAAARDLAARTLVPLRPVQRLLAGDLSGIGVNYRFTWGPREPAARAARGRPKGRRSCSRPRALGYAAAPCAALRVAAQARLRAVRFRLCDASQGLPQATPFPCAGGE
jgi:FAD binding domain